MLLKTLENRGNRVIKEFNKREKYLHSFKMKISGDSNVRKFNFT